MKKQKRINTAMNVNEKRNKIIIIITIVIVSIIVLLGGIFAILSLTTDLFKSEKDLFFKYALNLESEKNKDLENNLKSYFEKKNTTAYNNSGLLSINEINEESTENQINNFNISFSGKTDKTKSLAEQEIDFNYSDNIKLPIKYKRVEDIYGLQTDYVSQIKYISVDINKIGELIGKPDLDIKSILNELSNFQNTFEFSNEEKESLKEYGKLLKDELNDDKFSKTDDGSHKLTLSQQDMINIQIKILEKLKNDTVILNKINQILQEGDEKLEITSETIDEYIKELNENGNGNLENIIYEIIIHATDGKTDKFSISIKNEEVEVNYSLNIESNDDSLNCNNTLSIYQSSNDANYDFSVDISLNGLSKIEAVNEKYTLGIKIDANGEKLGEANYTYNNNIYFDDSISIEPFSDENKFMLTDMSSDEVGNFLTSLGERMVQVDQQLKQQAGITSNESIISPLISTGILATGIQVYNQSAAITNGESMNEVEKAAFNSKFTQYEGSNLTGAQVKSLIYQVIASNANVENEDKQIKITGVITLEGTDFIEGDSSLINNSSKYSVTISGYNNNGFASDITIEEK